MYACGKNQRSVSCRRLPRKELRGVADWGASAFGAISKAGQVQLAGTIPLPRLLHRRRSTYPLYASSHFHDDFLDCARTFAQRTLCAAAMRSRAAADSWRFTPLP